MEFRELSEEQWQFIQPLLPPKARNWISELELVLVAIARNTEVMRRVAERYEQAEMPAAQGLHPSPRAGS
jgi:hypothetical protein